MAIPTSRTQESPVIEIDGALCTGCGLCASVCSDGSLEIVGGKATRMAESVFECIGCGHCMAICPSGAVAVRGRELGTEHIYDLASQHRRCSYEDLLAALQHRRSIRDFKDRIIEPELIEKILTAAQTAPMGLPPTDVHVLIFDSREKTRAFAEDFAGYLKNLKFMTSNLFLALMRPFWGKETDQLFKGFLKPLFKAYTTEGIDKGRNTINYDAPLAMYFYGSPYSDPADPLIAATYAMIAAETLGLGTCMLGAVHPFIQNGKRAKAFREKHGIRWKSREGIFVIFGYAKAQYTKGIRRTFASVDYHP